MNSPDIERELKAASVAPSTNLPAGFSNQILLKARQVKKTAQQHWRLLISATVIALIGATYISERLTRSSVNKPPSISVFETNGNLFSDPSSRY